MQPRWTLESSFCILIPKHEDELNKGVTMQVTINVPNHLSPSELKWRIQEFEESLARESQQQPQPGLLKEALDKLRGKGTFKKIKDPAKWQREIRRDRDLPHR